MSPNSSAEDGSMVRVLIKRRHSYTMNRARVLLFWIPVGFLVLSLLYLLASPRSSSTILRNSPPAANADALPAANADTPSALRTNAPHHSKLIVPHMEYQLVENATIINTHGESRRFLRYSAREQKEDGSYATVSTLRWAQLMTNHEHGTIDDIHRFVRILKDNPMEAYFFETPGASHTGAKDAPFEFVLVESPNLHRFADARQDPETFRERFDACGGTHVGCIFANPAGDSVLVAPMPVGRREGDSYGHLGAFVRRAPIHQVLRFWKLVAQYYLERLRSVDPEKVWLSTDGTGVAWLHVRMDPRPKYYDYGPYVQGE